MNNSRSYCLYLQSKKGNMGMDVDYIAAMQSIDELKKIVEDTEHGKREEIADVVIELVRMVKDAYSKTDNPSVFQPASVLIQDSEEVIEKKELTITISGPPNSGKYRVLFLIKKALQENDLQVNFSGAPDFSSEKDFDEKIGHNIEKAVEALKKLVVISIKEVCLQKQPSRVFSDNDWNHMHDCVLHATWNTTQKRYTREELEELFDELPAVLKGEAVSWGMSDTVWRDNFTQWYVKNKLNK